MHTDKQYTDRFAREVIDLHVFFEDWFGGYCENSEQVFAERLLDRMHGNFNIILPGGMMIYGAHFWPEFRKLYGSNPDFHISIRAVQQHPLPGEVGVSGELPGMAEECLAIHPPEQRAVVIGRLC